MRGRCNYDLSPDDKQLVVVLNATAAGEGTDTLTGVERITDGSGHTFLLVDGHGSYTSIQDAIDAATDGDTIVVAAGTYAEHLVVNKDVTIFGNNDGAAGNGVRGAETVINGQVNVTVAGVTIDGVSITGAAAGSLGTTAVEVTGNNFSLVNSILNGSGNVAIITGTVTNVCCESSARDAMMLNFKTIMVSDANAAFTDDEHNATLASFYTTFGDVMDTDALIECLERNAAQQRAAE